MLRDLRFNVLVEGQGPDVLLVHGFPDSNSVWRNQIPALVDAGYRVIAPDLRGFGQSDAPRERDDYKIDEFVEDLVGDPRFARSAHRAPRRARLGSGSRLADVHQARRSYRPLCRVGGRPSVGLHARRRRPEAQGVLRSLLPDPRPSEKLVSANDWWLWRQMLRYDAEMPTWKEDLSRPGRLTAAINIYRANLGLILPKDRPKVAVPTMGVWGEGDVALAERQMVASANYVTAPWRYERVERGTHWLQLEAPDKTTSCCSTSSATSLTRDGPSAHDPVTDVASR